MPRTVRNTVASQSHREAAKQSGFSVGAMDDDVIVIE